MLAAQIRECENKTTASSAGKQIRVCTRKVDVRLLVKGNMAQGRTTNVISMIKWIRTRRSSIKIYLSLHAATDRVNPRVLLDTHKLGEFLPSCGREGEVPWTSSNEGQAWAGLRFERRGRDTAYSPTKEACMGAWMCGCAFGRVECLLDIDRVNSCIMSDTHMLGACGWSNSS